MKTNTQKLVQTALLLTICLLSQYFKNISVYLTGPVINACLLVAVLAIGLPWALLLCVITPVTAFFISGSPIMAGIPLMFPAIMGGNAVYVFLTYFFETRLRAAWKLPCGMLAASFAKALFMGLVIVGVLLPVFGANIAPHLPKPEALPKVLAAAKVTFSLTQLVTALLGSLLAYLIWMPLKKYLHSKNG